MKKLILCLLGIVMTVLMAAQSFREHVVVRGETIASIAARYGISQAALIEANPSAKTFIYVGMKLRIPDAPAPVIASSKQEIPVQSPTPTKQSESVSESSKSQTSGDAVEDNDAKVGGYFGFVYSGSFDAPLKYGTYGIQGMTYRDGGCGIIFSVVTNFKYSSVVAARAGATFTSGISPSLAMVFPLYASAGFYNDANDNVKFRFGGFGTGINFIFGDVFGDGIKLDVGPDVVLSTGKNARLSVGFHCAIGLF